MPGAFRRGDVCATLHDTCWRLRSLSEAEAACRLGSAPSAPVLLFRGTREQERELAWALAGIVRHEVGWKWPDEAFHECSREELGVGVPGVTAVEQ